MLSSLYAGEESWDVEVVKATHCMEYCGAGIGLTWFNDSTNTVGSPCLFFIAGASKIAARTLSVLLES